jgi:prevent-host-death family protein
MCPFAGLIFPNGRKQPSEVLNCTKCTICKNCKILLEQGLLLCDIIYGRYFKKKAMEMVSITDFRQHISEITNKVIFGGEKVFIERNGKPACVLISIKDNQLLEAIEDRIDIEEALKVLKNKKFISRHCRGNSSVR